MTIARNKCVIIIIIKKGTDIDIIVQSDRKKDRHTNKPYKQTDRQTGRQTNKQEDKNVDIHRLTWLLYGLQDGEKMMNLSQTVYIGYYE